MTHSVPYVAPLPAHVANRSNRLSVVAMAKAKPGSSSKKGFQKEAAKSTPSSCLCGSKLKYQGQWAPTPSHLARARFSALLMELPEFLADTTHPESNDLIGGRLKLARNVKRESKQYLSAGLALQDVWFAEAEIPEKEAHLGSAAYFVVYASQTGNFIETKSAPPSGGGFGAGKQEKVAEKRKNLDEEDKSYHLTCDYFLKLNGRWMFFKHDNDPVGPGLQDFLTRFDGDIDPNSSSDDDTGNTLGLTLTQPLRTSAASQLLGPWLVDEWPLVHPGAASAASSTTPSSPSSAGGAASSARGFVYLDDVVADLDDSGAVDGMDEQERSAFLRSQVKKEGAAMRSDDFDADAYKYRQGQSF
eukprot:gene22936-30116_t